MVSCLLVQVARNKKGLQASNEIRIAGETIDIGRGTACQIHLSDPRVSLLHATLKRSDDGTLRIESAHGALISINGFVEQTGMLSLGTQVRIAPYLLTVGPATADADITLSIDMAEVPAGAAEAPQVAPVTLAALGISKRRIGLWLAALILLAFLILPLLPRLSSGSDAWQAGLPIMLTKSLSPGPLSNGHGMLGPKCSSCHERAFQAVTDSTCRKCHERTAMHLLADPAHENVLYDIRCADCHPAHQGKRDAMRGGVPQCIACHNKQGKSIADVTDFGIAHPEFQLTVPAGNEFVRFRPGEKDMPQEKSGLKFSHKAHLVKTGISTPEGDTVLTCRSCHKLESSGIHFAPMEMEKTCQQSRCHKLRLSEPVFGVVSHGSEREAMSRVRNFYTNWLADAPVNIKECGPAEKAGNIIRRTLDCADMLARKHAASSLFRERGEKLQCPLCHQIVETESKEVPWKVVSPRINRDWQPSAIFTHAKHHSMSCADCHDKVNSQSSEDISLPRIEKCRECHAGFVGDAVKIKSNCESCHRFHRVDSVTTSE